MEKFINLTAKTLPLDLDNVDTDMIIPAHHLKNIGKSGYGQSLFSNLKNLYPDFILNNPAYEEGKILLSKKNFGCGSSREHAVWAIQQYGIRAVVCSSFSDIFFNNAAKNGLLLITLPESIIDSWLKAAIIDSNLLMTIDLAKQTISFINTTVHFDYNHFRKHCLLNGVDDLDYLLSIDQAIKQYEIGRNK